MKYIIDEEELKEFANNVKFNHPSVSSDWQTDKFLKSKTPVMEIFNNKFDYREFMGDCEKKKYADLDNELSMRNGKKFKLFIQEEK